MEFYCWMEVEGHLIEAGLEGLSPGGKDVVFMGGADEGHCWILRFGACGMGVGDQGRQRDSQVGRGEQ